MYKPLTLALVAITTVVITVASLFSGLYVVNALRTTGYNACVSDILSTVQSTGKVSIPVVTNEGEEGTIVLLPLTQTDEETTSD